MNKIELFKLAAEIYPCPPYKGVEVIIDFKYYGLYYLYHSCKDFFHVYNWVNNICLILGFGPGSITIING